MTAAADVYHAEVHLTVDTSQDEYTVVWFKNGAPITSGITVPKIAVAKRADGSDLVAETAMTEIGSTHVFKYDEASDTLTGGEAGIATVTATIDAATRTWKWPVSRDVS